MRNTRLLRLAASVVVALLLCSGRTMAQDGTSATPSPSASSAPAPVDNTVRTKSKIHLLTPAQTKPTATHIAPQETAVSAKQISNNAPGAPLATIVQQSVPGATQLEDGQFRIRGSDNQYTYYIDGAPLPEGVAGTLSDEIDPRDIQSMRVYTGGFPAEYGGQLAAVFDVATKSGSASNNGSITQGVGAHDTSETTGEFGGASRRTSVFAALDQTYTGLALTPVAQTVLHDNGETTVGFVKVDYHAGDSDRIVFHVAGNGSTIEVPNTPDRESVGQSDVQHESGALGDAVWTHNAGLLSSHLALYTRQSHLKYDSSPNDLLPSPDSSDLTALFETPEDQTIDTVGMRLDNSLPVGDQHRLGFGVNWQEQTGQQFFSVISPPSLGTPVVSDNGPVSAGDRGAYVEDDWVVGPATINYGGRFDEHTGSGTCYHESPRVNVKVRASSRDVLDCYDDTLFQPIPVENVANIARNAVIGQGAALETLRPETDTLVGGGWQHRFNNSRLNVDAYYRAIRNARDDEQIGNTNVTVQINEESAYVRGIEGSYDIDFSKTVSGYVNYGRAWGKNKGPVVGGLAGDVLPPGYFYDDHDQTNVASFGMDYTHHGVFGSLYGTYSSGLPYGEIDDQGGNPLAINYLRVPGETTVNGDFGFPVGKGTQVLFTATNILNHPFVINEAGLFNNTQWDTGRSLGVKVTQKF